MGEFIILLVHPDIAMYREGVDGIRAISILFCADSYFGQFYNRLSKKVGSKWIRGIATSRANVRAA